MLSLIFNNVYIINILLLHLNIISIHHDDVGTLY